MARIETVDSVSLQDQFRSLWPYILSFGSLLCIYVIVSMAYTNRTALLKLLRKSLRSFRSLIREWKSWFYRSPIGPQSVQNAEEGMSRSLQILSNPTLERTRNHELLLLAASKPKPPHQDVIEVRMALERELSRPVADRFPATELRNRLKALASLLKLATVEERTHISETLGNLFMVCLITTMVSYFACYLQYFGGDVFPSFNPETFFRPPGALFGDSFISFGSIFSILGSLGTFFLPFGWNLASLLPYVMALTTISSFARLPLIGPLVSRIFYIVLAVRFFWLQLPSLITAVAYTSILVLLVGWPMIRYGLPRLYILIPLCFASLFLGYLVMIQDPTVRYVQNPLLSLCTKLNFCAEWY